MKKILFLAAIGLLFAAGNADAKAVKLGKSDDGGSRIAAAKEKRVKSVKCEKGQFKNSDGVCVGCTVANCAECKSAGVCKRCNAGYSLLSGGTCGCASHAVCGDKQICENKICVDLPCPDGYYASEHKCKACSSNCLTCSDQNTCTSCEPGKYLSGGSCNGCSAKFSNCLECDSTKCTKCDGETDKINGVCVEPGCKTSADCAGNQVCNASHECEECPEGYEKQGDSCVPEGSDPECTIDAECDENEKCSDEACVLKTCAEINASYKTSCSDNQTKTDTGVDGSDGACYSCKDPDPECSSDSNCGACQTCSGGTCVDLSCGEGKVCDNNHGCKDKDPGPEPGACSSDCDCQWWQVCSNKKCVTASSCSALDACKRSKGQGGNYSNSNTGNCSSQYINVANMTCWICQPENDCKKNGNCTCSQIDPRYYPKSLATGEYSNYIDVGETGADGVCVRSCSHPAYGSNRFSGSNFHYQHKKCLFCSEKLYNSCASSSVYGGKCCDLCKYGWKLSETGDSQQCGNACVYSSASACKAGTEHCAECTKSSVSNCYYCTKCENGYGTDDDAGVCYKKGKGATPAVDTSCADGVPACTTSGCATKCCPSHGGGTCSSCHKEWGQGQYWYMCDSCSSGTKMKIGSNYFYSCVK